MTAHEITLKVGSPHQLRDHILRAAGHCTPGGSVRHTLDDLLTQVEAQLPKPMAPEPEAFGSIIRATTHSLRCKWQRSPLNGTHYWQSEFGDVEVWSELTDVEVLRVGLGGDAISPHAAEIVAAQEAGFRDGIRIGKQDVVAKMHGQLQLHYAEAISAERKNAIERMIAVVEELAP